MPAEKLSMKKIREVLRLYSKGLSYRAISKNTAIGLGSVSEYIKRAKAAKLSWPLPEELNDFIDWITFGKDSVIHENNSITQQKIIAFGRMVANAVMFHTVANTTNVLNQLSAQGVEYSGEDLSILSAYFRENINRYGVFELSRLRQKTPLEFSIYRD